MSSVYLLPYPARVAIDAIFNPHASIIVFFVLSGYVLSASLSRRGLSWSSVRGFYVNRFFRLFPPLWVASAVSAAFLLCVPKRTMHPTVTLWFYLYLQPFPSLAQLILAVFAIDRSLIMPVWSIFVELMGSAVMPILLLVSRSKQKLFKWVVLATGLLSYALAYAPHRIDSLGYLFDFALGTWLASREWKIFDRYSLLKVSGAAFVLIFFRFLWFSALNGHPMALYAYGDPFTSSIESIAAFVVIGVLASTRGRTPLLGKPWLIRLGDLSYGLYLIHFPVVVLLTKLLSRLFSDQTSPTEATAILMPIGLVISLGLATALNRLIEMPFIALGKRVSTLIARRDDPVKIT